MEWETIAHYLIARGFIISPESTKDSWLSLDAELNKKEYPANRRIATNQKIGSMVDPTINRTLPTISPPRR